MDDTVGDHQKALSHLSWPKAESKESGTPSRVQFRLRSGQRRGSFPGIIKGTFAFFLRVLTCIFRIITNFQLEKRVQFHEHLRPVCLPTANTQLIPGTLCTVIGWGKKNDTDSMYLKILKGLVICSNQIRLPIASEYELAVNEVQVPVLNRKVCNFWIAYKEMNVTEGMICAGYPDGGKDACQVSLIGIFMRNYYSWNS